MLELSAVTSAPWKETIGGKAYWLEPLTLSDWGIVEKRLLNERRDPIAIARHELADLQPDEKRILLEAALKQTSRANLVSFDEMVDYTTTPSGMALMLWLALRKRHPETTESQAVALLDRMGQEAYARLQPNLSGEGPSAETPSKKALRQGIEKSEPSPGSKSSTD